MMPEKQNAKFFFSKKKRKKKKENAPFEAKRDSHKDRRAEGRSDCRIMNEIFVTVSYKLQYRKNFSLLKRREKQRELWFTTPITQNNFLIHT